MAWVETRITRTTQPQDGVGIDWTNPLTQGLVFSDGIQNANIFATTGTLTKSVSPVGISTVYGSGKTTSKNTGYKKSTTEKTYFFLANVLNAGISPRLFDKRTASVSTQVELFYFGSGNLIYEQAGTSGNGSWSTNASGIYGKTTGIALAYSTLSNSNVPSVFFNGTPQSLASATQPSGTPLTNTAEYVIGNRGNDLARLLEGEILATYFWDRLLSDVEIKYISENPWQIFEPEVSRIWVDGYVSAGGGATTVSSDASADYAIRAAISSDAAASYPVRSATSSDTTAAYPLRAATQSDTTAAYAIRSAASADALASYYVLGLVQSDTAGSYAVRAAAQSDALASYAVRSAVQSDVLASYEILSAGVVVSDSPASYAIRSAVQADGAASYPVRSVAQADAAGAYAVRAAVWSDAGASYAVQGALVAVWADATANYFVDGVVATHTPGAQTRPSRLQSSSRPSRLQTGTRASR